ncbi:MAG: Ryanodine receptor Ryr [Ruminococcaceae bacterium]|nr:Ryanodine receptor Ryr [Oscillospiraceae bacterium]
MYTPKPINTDNISLDRELIELTEKIAENVHETWAKARIAEGWTLGEKRDDIKKTTPCLVPYNELPESEKEYDRITAIGTLKLIIALGYKIEKNDSKGDI